MLLPPLRFTEKFELVFVLTHENAFSYRFHFKATRKTIVLLKNATRDFKNSPPCERLTCFYVKITISFLVESTKIENAIF